MSNEAEAFDTETCFAAAFVFTDPADQHAGRMDVFSVKMTSPFHFHYKIFTKYIVAETDDPSCFFLILGEKVSRRCVQTRTPSMIRKQLGNLLQGAIVQNK